MAKVSFSKPTASKPAGRKVTNNKLSSSRQTRGSSGRNSGYSKPQSTTNIGTRPSVMPGQPGVPTGGSRISVMPGQPGVPTGGTRVTNRASSLASPGNGKAVMMGINPTVAAIARAAQAAQAARANTVKVANPIIHTPAPTSRPANRMNHPAETRPFTGGTTGGTRTGGGTVTPTAVTPVAPPNPLPTEPPATPNPPAPPIHGNPNPTPGFRSLMGRNVTAGQFNRRRQGRGPLSNESLTPEELRRIASQKVNNYG